MTNPAAPEFARRALRRLAGALLAATLALGLPTPPPAGAAPGETQTAIAPMGLLPPPGRTSGNASPAVMTGGPTVIGSRLGLHPGKTRLVVEMTEPVPYRISAEADPFRVVVEFERLSWPEAATPRGGMGSVIRYRPEATASGGTRLVLDVRGPTLARNAFLIPPSEGARTRLVIDLETVDLGRFMRERGRPVGSGAPAGESAPPAHQPPPPAQSVPQSAPPPAAVAPLPPVAGNSGSPAPPSARPVLTPAAVTGSALAAPPAAREAPAPRRRPGGGRQVIVIDPGHGGVDPGAIGVGGIHEKDITLAMARALRRQLEASGNYRVILTRDDDVFIRLRDRAAKAREVQADLFISLHADSIRQPQIHGLSIYTLSDKASDREAESLAAQENRADAIGGINLSAETDQVASILIDLAQRDTMNHSRRFSAIAARELKRVINLLPKPQRSAGFAVLTAPDVPSVLIEMGYLSNPQDSSLLTQNSHRERFAAALAAAIDDYFDAARGKRRTS